MAAGKDRIDLPDAALWNEVSKTVTPLRGVRGIPPAKNKVPENINAAKNPAPRPQKPPRPKEPDRGVCDELRRDKARLEARFDLHGLRAREARDALLGFLRRCQKEGKRTVLVITGKGLLKENGGVLRREVPLWLETPPFRDMVLGHAEARRKDGGGGALYLRLRKPD